MKRNPALWSADIQRIWRPSAMAVLPTNYHYLFQEAGEHLPSTFASEFKKGDAGMQNYQRILAVVDLSDRTEPVIRRAQAEARNNSARIMVLHVVDYALPDTDILLPSFEEVEESLISEATERLDKILMSYDEPRAERLVVAGSPVKEILRIAAQEKADLLVIGSHGHRGLRDILGSTTDRVVHQADLDVLIVRG